MSAASSPNEIEQKYPMTASLPVGQGSAFVKFFRLQTSKPAYVVVIITGAWSLVPTSARTTQLAARSASVGEARM